MYNSPMALGTGATAGGLAMLPHTGFEVLWFVLAAVALLGAGLALLRVMPRRLA